MVRRLKLGCSECEKAQKELEYVSFVRVSNANVMLVGCREHIRQLLHTYNRGSALGYEK